MHPVGRGGGATGSVDRVRDDREGGDNGPVVVRGKARRLTRHRSLPTVTDVSRPHGTGSLSPPDVKLSRGILIVDRVRDDREGGDNGPVVVRGKARRLTRHRSLPTVTDVSRPHGTGSLSPPDVKLSRGILIVLFGVNVVTRVVRALAPKQFNHLGSAIGFDAFLTP